MLNFGFYNSSNGDRKYDATDFSAIFESIMEDGVHRGIGNEFAVTAVGGLSLLVGTGRAWFRRTWNYNDSDIPITATAANAAQPRTDLVVLEVDSSTAVRSNRIFLLPGTAQAGAPRPTLANTATLKQVALYSIARPAGSSSILQSNITKLVGTTETPYAVSRLLDRMVEPAVMHRNVFRGKNLGTAVTSAQSAAIANQSFEDIYVGDYWEINGVKWRIADINYWYRKGDPVVNTPHVVIVPDTKLGSGNWNVSGNTSGGYINSTLNQAVTAVYSQISQAFGSKILPVRTVYTNAVDGNGYPTGAAWYEASAQTMSAMMVFGANIWNWAVSGASVPALNTEATSQFSLFHLAPDFIPCADNTGYWLRDTVGYNWAAFVSGPPYGTHNRAAVSDLTGVRPAFAIR